MKASAANKEIWQQKGKKIWEAKIHSLDLTMYSDQGSQAGEIIADDK